MTITRLRPSFTFTEDRLAELRGVVPEAFADGRVNWEALKEALGEWTEAEGADAEHFGLFWPGKREARRLAAKPSRGTLVPVPGEGVNEETTRNLFIEGDNLEVLKLLQKSYAGRVKMIYIDPPYNTGNDFVYKDDFRDPLGDYLRKTGQVDEAGEALTTNTRADGRFHSNWLSMMYPRLRLARTLLLDDGVLLVSCNDVEQAHLKVILAEIFGEENHAATFIWNNEGNIDNQSKIKANHEFIHVFAKSIERLDRPSVIDPNIEETSKLYNDEIENSITKNGPANPPSKVRLPAGFPATFASGVIGKRRDKWPHILEDIVVEGSCLTQSAIVESGWSSRNLLQLFIDNGFQPIRDSEGKETRFAVTASGAIYGYKKRSESQGHVLTVLRNVGTTKQNSSMLTKWGLSFDWPKPLLLIRYLCQVFTRPGDVVLDFFAGSGTTAHATMALNALDQGGRSFICVQFPEPMEGAFSNIAALAVHRIRSASAELVGEHPDLSADQLGFRVLRYVPSNFRAWEDYDGEDVEQLEALFEDAETPLVKGWSPGSLLTEILLLQGFPLDAQVVLQATLNENDVHLVTSDHVGHRLWVCLDRKIHDATVASLAPAAEDVVVCLDSALDDEAKLRLADRCTLETI